MRTLYLRPGVLKHIEGSKKIVQKQLVLAFGVLLVLSVVMLVKTFYKEDELKTYIDENDQPVTRSVDAGIKEKLNDDGYKEFEHQLKNTNDEKFNAEDKDTKEDDQDANQGRNKDVNGVDKDKNKDEKDVNEVKDNNDDQKSNDQQQTEGNHLGIKESILNNKDLVAKVKEDIYEKTEVADDKEDDGPVVPKSNSNATSETCYIPDLDNWIDFYYYIKKDSGMCREKKILGGYHHQTYFIGHKTLCMDPAYMPKKNHCLVLSFGIEKDWSFDDKMEEYGCKVYSFNPTEGLDHHKISKNLVFYPISLSDKDSIFKGNETRRNSVEILTYESVLKKIRLTEYQIDYLKIDIEGEEIKFLRNVLEQTPHLLNNIKQLGITVHPMKSVTLRNQFWELLHHLNCFKFTAVSSKADPRHLFDTGRAKESTSYDLVFINKKYAGK